MLTKYRDQVDQKRCDLLGNTVCTNEFRLWLDANGRMLSIGPLFASALGYHPSDLQDRSIFPYINPLDMGRARRTWQEIVDTYEPRTEVLRFRHKTDGRWPKLVCLGTPILVEDELKGFVVFFHLVDDEIQRDKSNDSHVSGITDIDGLIRELRLQLSKVDKDASHVSIVDENGIIRYCSDERARLVGDVAERAEGTSVYDRVHPEDIPRLHTFTDEIFRTKQPSSAVLRFWNQKANDWLEVFSECIPIIQDGFRGYLVVSASNQSKLEIALEKMCLDPMYAIPQIERCKTMFKRAGVQRYMVLDVYGIVRYASEGHEEFTGWTESELVGQNNMEKVHPDDAERAISEMQFMLLNKTNEGVEYRFLHKDGRWLPVRVFAAPLMKDGAYYGFVVVAHGQRTFDMHKLILKLDVNCVIDILGLKPKSEPGQ